MTLHLKEKKDNNPTLNCCVQGEVISLDKVNDEIFSTGILGDGFAVIPKDKKVCSPSACVVKDITDNGLAITLKTDDGLHLLVHFGLNLSELKPSPVNFSVKVGDRLNAGDILAEIDFERVNNEKLDPTICVIITNSDDLTLFTVNTGDKTTDSCALEYSF